MISDTLHDFLIASVGASASFIGLLFVALTLVLGRLPKGSPLAVRERALAESSYTALITVFFISMIGLVPGASIGWAMVAMGWLGALASLRLSRSSLGPRSQKDSRRVVGTLTVFYVGLAAFGLYTSIKGDVEINTSVFIAILFVFYTTALGRAWALIGVENHFGNGSDG